MSSYALALETRCSSDGDATDETKDNLLSDPPLSINNLVNFLSLESSMR